MDGKTLEEYVVHPEHAHLRKVWAEYDLCGNLQLGTAHDRPLFFNQGGEETEVLVELANSICADDTDEDPMDSLDRGWKVPFWIVDERLSSWLESVTA